MTKIRAVQFLGFPEAEEGGEPHARFALERATFDHRPQWLLEVMEKGRLSVNNATGAHRPGELEYNPPVPGHRFTVEEGGYLVNLGKGELRVVDKRTFEAVRSVSG